MTTEMLGAAGMTEELKQYYTRKMLDVAVTDTVFEKYADMNGIPSREGKSINWRRFEKIDVNEGSYTLVEGSINVPAIQATISAVVATISQYGQWAEVSDVLETQAIDPVLTQYSVRFGEAMSEGRDIIVRSELSNATNIQYADSQIHVGTSGTGSVGSGNYMDAAEILEAVRTLRRTGVKKINGYYNMFIHPDNTKDLFQDSDIVDAFQYAQNRGDANPLFTGVLGEWMGVRFIETNNLKIHSSYGMSGADTYEVIMFGQGFYGATKLDALSAKVIVHPRGTGGHTDPLDQKSTVGWKCSLAAKILNNDFGVLIHCASSRSNAA